MMKKLNNKGLTAIEILVCFSIVIVIVMSMFKVVNNQKDKQTIESYKNSIITYKNSIMKTIEDDIKTGGGITNATISDSDELITVAIKFNNSSEKVLKIHKKLDCDESNENNACETFNYIVYNGETFKIPDIYNLKFNKTEVSKITEKINDNLTVYYLKIYVGFNHPDLGNKYTAIDIIEPIANSDNPYF